MLEIRAYNAAAAISLADYAERAVCLRRGTRDRVAATREAISHSVALLVNIDALVTELTRQLTSKGWLWPSHLPLASPSPEMEAKLLAAKCRRSAQETRVRAKTMPDAEARRTMHEIAMQYEDLAAQVENPVPRPREPPKV
jgi:hypothetical protein